MELTEEKEGCYGDISPPVLKPSSAHEYEYEYKFYNSCRRAKRGC
jgi:hypothetical protein